MCIPWGCGDSIGGQTDRCEGKRGWLEGVLCRDRVKTTLESQSRGGSVLAQTPEEEADKGLE